MSGTDALTIPGPSGRWLSGNLPEFRAGMLRFLTQVRDEFGPIARFRLGPRRIILVSDPSLIEEVLVTHNKSFRKHYATRLLRPVLGRGLLLNEGNGWLRQRRLVQPAFCRAFTDQFSRTVASHCDQLAARWQAQPRRDLYQDMTQLTVEIAAHAFLGIRDPDQTSRLGRWLEIIHADFEHRFLHPLSPPAWFPSGRNRRLRSAVAALTGIIDQMINQRRRDAEGSQDALSLLLLARDDHGQSMPIQMLRDEVMTLLLAGHDTTANGLTWTWSLLAQHSGVHQKVANEAARWQNGQVVAVPKREHLPTIWRVIKESMRLYPPAYMIGREAIKPVRIGGYAIGKGESLIMSQWSTHRDPRFFSDPNEFKPDRWTEPFEKSLPRYAYFPFGGGPRVCIGKELAMIEAATVLAALTSRFDVTLDQLSDVEPWPTVTLRPRGAVAANVAPIQTLTSRTIDASPVGTCPFHGMNAD